MSSRASIAGHPVHPMIVPIPIGLFLFSFAADLATRFGWGEPWPAVALYTMAGGLAGALLAAVFGMIDLLALRRNTEARRTGLAHMAINVAVIVIYFFNFALRLQGETVTGSPFVLSAVAILALAVSGWLGGHLVYVHGVGVASRTSPPYVERRQMRMPVRHERRRVDPGSPLAQH